MVNLIVGSLMLTILLLILPGLVRVWRGGEAGRHQYDPFAAPAAWPWGEHLWRGAYRAMLVYEAFLIAIALRLICLAVPSLESSAVAPALSWGVIALFLSICVITAFNRPRFVVPQRLRDEPGELRVLMGRATPGG